MSGGQPRLPVVAAVVEGRLNHKNFNLSLLRDSRGLTVSLGLIICLAILTPLIRASGIATFIEPISPPPGGRTGVFLDTSTNNQKKLGSLLIGTNQNPTHLCLNTIAKFRVGDFSDPIYCISSWSDLGGIMGGSYVALQQSIPADINNPALYTLDLGYSRLMGTGGTDAYTYTSDAGMGIAAIRINGGDPADQNKWAANFWGRVKIEGPMDMLGGVGRLCLNGPINDLRTLGNPDGKCITQWSDLTGGLITDYVKLRPEIPFSINQSGKTNINRTGNFGAVVFGAPPPDFDPVNIPDLSFCGDGQCSEEIGENLWGTGHTCTFDCDGISNLTTFTATGLMSKVELKVKPTALSSGGSVLVLIVRSNYSTSSFKPINGVNYAAMGDTEFAVIYSGILSTTTTTTITDASQGFLINQRYWYRAYQANLFPRYSGYLAADAYASGGGGGGGEPGEPPPKPPKYYPD